MNFFLAMLVWIVLSAVLGVAVFLTAVKGMPWVLVVTSIVLVGMVARIGCRTH